MILSSRKWHYTELHLHIKVKSIRHKIRVYRPIAVTDKIGCLREQKS